jgi:hypothetical protein
MFKSEKKTKFEKVHVLKMLHLKMFRFQICSNLENVWIWKSSCFKKVHEKLTEYQKKNRKCWPIWTLFSAQCGRYLALRIGRIGWARPISGLVSFLSFWVRFFSVLLDFSFVFLRLFSFFLVFFFFFSVFSFLSSYRFEKRYFFRKNCSDFKILRFWKLFKFKKCSHTNFF